MSITIRRVQALLSKDLTITGNQTYTGTVTLTNADPTISFVDGATTAQLSFNSGNVYIEPHSNSRDIIFRTRNDAVTRATIDTSLNGAYIYGNGVGDYTGSGSPEGALTAAVGSTYRRSDGGAGTSFYVKESGAGNTGWVAK